MAISEVHFLPGRVPTSKEIAYEMADGAVLVYGLARITIVLDHNGQRAYAYTADDVDGFGSRPHSWGRDAGGTEANALECLADEIREFWSDTKGSAS